MIHPELKFINNYLKLIKLSNDESSDSFTSTSNYSKIQTLGPVLPPFQLNIDFSDDNKDINKVRKLKLIFKSIKPPFKFNTELTNVPSNFSIYNVKMSLIENQKNLKNVGLDPDEIKLLVKSKVISDTVTLDSIASSESQICFNCMINSRTNKQSKNTLEKSVDKCDIDNKKSISATTWNKIYDLLKKEFTCETEAQQTLENFKKCF